jgi:NAD(P)-dependent dehydrogenase (short-subunit alcohol dehydrogenase family)
MVTSVVLITGESTGIGRPVAVAFAKEGAMLFATSDNASFIAGQIINVIGGKTAS